MSDAGPIRTLVTPSNRRRAVLSLGAGAFVLLVILVSQAAFNLKFISLDSNRDLAGFAALSAIIFLLFVALTFVLARNLLKLYAERQLGIAGSKFRSRLVVVSLLLSFLPVIVMFFFSYGLMNRSIEKWFSQPVEEVRANTSAMASLLSTYAGQNASSEALSIAQSPEIQRAYDGHGFSAAIAEFRRHEPTLQGGFVIAFLDHNPQASFDAPADWVLLKSSLPFPEALAGQHPHFSFKEVEYVTGTAGVGEHGLILVAMPLPQKFSETVKQIQASQERYLALSKERKLVRRNYMGLLLLLTVLVLFASTWLALFLSKLVTRPVAALVEGTQEISRGRLDYRVDILAADEIGDLVRSFNRMAEELESNRHQIDTASSDLAAANAALDQRRRHMETILENIPTGVLSLDTERRITHVNAALERMVNLDRSDPASPVSLVGASLKEVFPVEVSDDLDALLRRADRMGMATSQMDVGWSRSKLDVAVTVASLQHRGQRLGYVLVFEDLSDLLKAQTQAAWREVARRVAHEIKNPLTPIALSAERIRRHLGRSTAPDSASLEIIRTCAATIGNAVETVRTLVDEFSALARFPASRPQPTDLNRIVQSALEMFNGRLNGIDVQTSLAPDLPPVLADNEAIKRAVANLVDNAAEALQNCMHREIEISTSLVASGDAVELVVADTGHGVTQELKEKLFLPYFSTKKRGTGLGLAIVNRIIEDHHGSIRVEENKPAGARFIVELPLAELPTAVVVS